MTPLRFATPPRPLVAFDPRQPALDTIPTSHLVCGGLGSGGRTVGLVPRERPAS